MPWQPASSAPSVGSPSRATSAASRSGRSRKRSAEAAVRRGDLLAGVEHVGHVDGRARRRVRASSSMHGQAALHVGRAEPAQQVALDARRARCRWPARCRCGRPAPAACGRPELGAGHQVVADPGDLEPRRAAASSCLEPVDERPLVVAHRRDVDELGGEREQVGHGALGHRWRHVGMPCAVQEHVVELRLVVALALGEALDDEHARQAELAARGRCAGRVAEHGHDHGGTSPGRAPRRSRRR